jgi:hypothetical protein
LPFGRLEGVGMRGSLFDTALMEKGMVPGCYDAPKMIKTKTVVWKKGYEDGGPSANKRMYPVRYIDHRSQSDWLVPSFLFVTLHPSSRQLTLCA